MVLDEVDRVLHSGMEEQIREVGRGVEGTEWVGGGGGGERRGRGGDGDE